MPTVAESLIATSAAIVLLLGLIHLLYTFRGRTRSSKNGFAMHPVLTRPTTMWKAWIGFNGSHSFAAIFFGVVYGCLSLAHGEFLFRSPFLLFVGLLLLLAYAFLGKRY